MSCEQMVKYQTAARPSVITGATNLSAVAASDPYVFTEPPSIQTLQLHKATAIVKNNGRASVYSMTTGTSAMKMPRHNVNESLKKKLGIANCRAVAAPLPSPAVTTPTHSSPMISGVKGRSKRQTTPKQLEFPDPIRSADCSRTTGRPARTTPKQKNAKRESKKTVQPVTNNTNNNNISREMDVQTIPEELWFGPCQSQDDALSALHMQTWFIPELCATVPASITTTLASAACPPFLHLSRDERLELKRSELRRRTIQVRNAQQHREIVTARRRFLYVQSVLMQEETVSHEQTTMIPDSVFSEELRLCRVDGCQDEALIFTAFCPVHVTGSHDEQLFAPCSVRFADKSQCRRVPVFDESHETPFCREHAAAAGREKDSRQLPRLTTERVVTGKAAATGGGGGSAPAKNKKKSRSNNSSKRSTVPGKASAMPKVDLTPSLPRKSVYLNHHHQNGGGEAVPVVVNVQPTQLQPAPQQQKQTNLKIRRPEIVTRFAKVGSQAVHKMLVKEEQYDFVDEEDSVGLEEDVVEEEEEDDSLLQPRSKKSSPFAVKRKSYRANYGAAPMTTATNQTDLLLVSENSSAYESSEDTGVGGLSESEMIEEIGFDSQFLEDPEFNNVLEDLLAVEQPGEIFDGTTTFLGDFLADQVLRDAAADNVGHHVAAQNMIVSPHGHLNYVHAGGDSIIAPTTTQTTLIQT